MTDSCLFCGIVAGDVPSVKIAEDATTYAFMDIRPASEGHLLVIPKRHSRDLTEIEPADLSEVTLAAPERSIAAPDLAPAGLVGIVEQSDAAPAWSGQWRDASSTLFLRAWLGADAGAFHFTMLSVVPETSQ